VDLADAAAGERLDLPAQLDERIAQVVRQHLPQRGLARPAQADQRDAVAAPAPLRRRARREQPGQRLAGAAQLGVAAALQQLADHQPLG
jgi:hypothetical protein